VGSVRDHILNLQVEDYDIEVFGFDDISNLEILLKKFGRVKSVGKSFGVLKLNVDGLDLDISMPRVEEKVGDGHRGFIVEFNRELTFREASIRRDFTINSIGFSLNSNRLLDPHGGVRDIDRGFLRHIDSVRFQEDPLRVYRAVQFTARFNLSVSEDSMRLLKGMVADGSLDELPRERVYMEFKKLFLKSKKPSIGIELMRSIGVVDRYYPELLNVDIHKLDRVSRYGDMRFIFATIGIYNPDTIDSFIRKFTRERRLISDVQRLVEALLKFGDRANFRVKDVRELSTIVRVDRFLTLQRALNGSKRVRYIKRVAKRLKLLKTALKPLISGRDLISLGLTPSKEFSFLLKELYDRQIDGTIESRDDAINYLRKMGKI